MKGQLEHNGSHTGQVLLNHLNPVVVVVVVVNPRSDTLFRDFFSGVATSWPTLWNCIYLYTVDFCIQGFTKWCFIFLFIRVEPDTSQQTQQHYSNATIIRFPRFRPLTPKLWGYLAIYCTCIPSIWCQLCINKCIIYITRCHEIL